MSEKPEEIKGNFADALNQMRADHYGNDNAIINDLYLAIESMKADVDKIDDRLKKIEAHLMAIEAHGGDEASQRN